MIILFPGKSKSCLVSDKSCEAVCECFDGFNGPSCGESDADFAAKLV
jgi:hypothetical protein